MTRKLLTPEEGAAILRVNVKTLLRWARQKYVPGHRLGEGKRGLWRFLEDELVDWSESQKGRKA